MADEYFKNRPRELENDRRWPKMRQYQKDSLESYRRDILEVQNEESEERTKAAKKRMEELKAQLEGNGGSSAAEQVDEGVGGDNEQPEPSASRASESEPPPPPPPTVTPPQVKEKLASSKLPPPAPTSQPPALPKPRQDSHMEPALRLRAPQS
jgi:hypothetical protein